MKPRCKRSPYQNTDARWAQKSTLYTLIEIWSIGKLKNCLSETGLSFSLHPLEQMIDSNSKFHVRLFYRGECSNMLIFSINLNSVRILQQLWFRPMRILVINRHIWFRFRFSHFMIQLKCIFEGGIETSNVQIQWAGVQHHFIGLVPDWY